MPWKNPRPTPELTGHVLDHALIPYEVDILASQYTTSITWSFSQFLQFSGIVIISSLKTLAYQGRPVPRPSHQLLFNHKGLKHRREFKRQTANRTRNNERLMDKWNHKAKVYSQIKTFEMNGSDIHVRHLVTWLLGKNLVLQTTKNLWVWIWQWLIKFFLGASWLAGYSPSWGFSDQKAWWLTPISMSIQYFEPSNLNDGPMCTTFGSLAIPTKGQSGRRWTRLPPRMQQLVNCLIEFASMAEPLYPHRANHCIFPVWKFTKTLYLRWRNTITREISNNLLLFVQSLVKMP